MSLDVQRRERPSVLHNWARATDRMTMTDFFTGTWKFIAELPAAVGWTSYRQYSRGTAYCGLRRHS